MEPTQVNNSLSGIKLFPDLTCEH